VDNTASGTQACLGDGADATQHTWTSGGEANWVYQTATTYDGIDALQSGGIGDNAQSTLTLEPEGPGTLSFW
jgi:hypothetical protein